MIHIDSKHPSCFKNGSSNPRAHTDIEELHLCGHLSTTWSPLKIIWTAGRPALITFGCIDFPIPSYFGNTLFTPGLDKTNAAEVYFLQMPVRLFCMPWIKEIKET